MISSSFRNVPSPNDTPKTPYLRFIWPYMKGNLRLGLLGSIGMILVALLALPTPYITKVIVDRAILGSNLHLLNMLVLALIAVQLLRFGSTLGMDYCLSRFSGEIISRIKGDLFHRVLRFPISFFAHNQTGYIMSRIGEVDGLYLFFSSTLIRVLLSIGQFLLCLGILFHLNYKLTLFSLLVLPAFFLTSKRLSNQMRRLTWGFLESSAALTQGMHDSFSGVEVVKSFGAEKREALKVRNHLDNIKGMSIRRGILLSLYSESMSFLGACAGFGILWLSGGQIISHQFTLGSYLAFAAYFAQLFGPTQVMANLGLTLQPAKVALRRVLELQAVVTEEEDDHGRIISSLKGNIDIVDLDFEYEAAKPVLRKLCLHIRAGEKVLISGPNGSGKSTLIKLIMGFYRAQHGLILMDGMPLQDISLSSLRERMSIVSQNTFLFSDTVRNNILYSAPRASADSLKEAICLSGASDFIKHLANGLDTEIGERGVRLSGGERQKLSIARAILRRSDLIILDEATSNLDKSSIKVLDELVRTRFSEKTCLIISHRSIEMELINRFIHLVDGAAIDTPRSLASRNPDNIIPALHPD